MRSLESLNKRWDRQQLLHPFHAAIEITEHGIVFGAGTLLAQLAPEDTGDILVGEKDAERVFALLAVAANRRAAPDAIRHIEAALRLWHGGDKALAHLRLAFARLPTLASRADAYRLFLADEILKAGISPAALLAEIGLEAKAVDFSKYDSSEPRFPAGSGRTSGEWRSGGGSDAFVGPAAAAGRIAVRTLVGALSAENLAALAAFASRFTGPTAVLGALIIPTPNSGGITEGTLPDHPEIRFKVDGPEGTVLLIARGSDGSDIKVRARSERGVYIDVETGQPIGRDLDGQLLFDFDAVDEAIRSRNGGQPAVGADTSAASGDDEPKLCPAAQPDRGHGASDRANDYEDDVHIRVNPVAPIPRGFAVALPDPEGVNPVYFDDCFRHAGDLVDGDMRPGDMADAKGRRYAALLSDPNTRPWVMAKLLMQAVRQSRAAEARGVDVKWYFAEMWAADEVRREFKDRFPRIKISYMQPRTRR